jgi:hypothetical protein
MARRAVIVRVGDRPRDFGHGLQERAIDSHRLLQQFVQIVFHRRRSSLFAAQLAAQRFNDRSQALGIDELVEIRERAFTDFVHRQVFLCLLRLAEIFDGPQ